GARRHGAEIRTCFILAVKRTAGTETGWEEAPRSAYHALRRSDPRVGHGSRMTTDSGNQSGNPAGNRAADQATWLAALEETLGAGAAALDADGRLDDVSHGFARILREYPGQLLEELVDAEQRPELAAALAAVGAGALEH